MKVLRISHSGSVKAYRERERQLMKLGSIDLQLVIPTRWKHLGGSNEAVSEPFPVLECDTFARETFLCFPTIYFELRRSSKNSSQILSTYMKNHIQYHASN